MATHLLLDCPKFLTVYPEVARAASPLFSACYWTAFSRRGVPAGIYKRYLTAYELDDIFKQLSVSITDGTNIDILLNLIRISSRYGNSSALQLLLKALELSFEHDNQATKVAQAVRHINDFSRAIPSSAKKEIASVLYSGFCETTSEDVKIYGGKGWQKKRNCAPFSYIQQIVYHRVEPCNFVMHQHRIISRVMSIRIYINFCLDRLRFFIIFVYTENFIIEIGL